MSNNHDDAPDDRPELTDEAQVSWSTVHRLAANNEPAELADLAQNACTALLAHYRIAIEKWQLGMAVAVYRGKNCSETILEFAENIARASAEKARIVAVGDLLTTLHAEFPAARPDEIEKLVEGMGQDEAEEAGE